MTRQYLGTVITACHPKDEPGVVDASGFHILFALPRPANLPHSEQKRGKTHCLAVLSMARLEKHRSLWSYSLLNIFVFHVL
jgi:hypothetical protein